MQCGSRKILHWQLLEFLCHLPTIAWWLWLTPIVTRSYFIWRIQTVISTAIVSLLLRINNQNDMIDNAIRIVRETEDVSLEIERELARNREKINASREKVSLRCIRIFWVEIWHGMPRNQWCDCAIPDDARILLRIICTWNFSLWCCAWTALSLVTWITLRTSFCRSGCSQASQIARDVCWPLWRGEMWSSALS